MDYRLLYPAHGFDRLHVFATAVTFNPAEVANNLKKNGGFIPGYV